MSKHPVALLLGITGNLGFAAGCLLQALHRHSPHLGADIILYVDGTLPAVDEALLRDLGAKPTLFTPPNAVFSAKALQQFSLMALARLEGLRLLNAYEKIFWLDVDTAIQGDISALLSCGPLGLAQEDPWFTGGTTKTASINVDVPLPGLDMDAPNLNSGVLVLHDTLPDPAGLYRLCMEWIVAHGVHLKYMDQPVLNMLAHHLQRLNPALVARIPHDIFNAHPRNPAAQHAAIMHTFGAYKLWDDGLTRCAFPEWSRDYQSWLAAGGSPWKGEVDNADYLEGNAFSMLRRVYDSMADAQKLLDQQSAELTRLQAELGREQALRTRLETLLVRMSEK